MTLDRKDYKSAIPQLESRLAQIEKLGKDVFNKFEDIAHQTQLDAAEAEKKNLALDYQLNTLQVHMEYALVANGYDPSPTTQWSETVPTIDGSTSGMTLWYRSVTLRNDIVIQRTDPQKVNLMDGVYTFINSVSSTDPTTGEKNWTTIDGGTIQTGTVSADHIAVDDIIIGQTQVRNLPSALTNAEQRASLFITQISGGGITVHDAYDSLNLARITSDGMEVVKNNESVAFFGETARVGREGDYRTEIGNTSFSLKDAKDNVAFGVTATGEVRTSNTIIYSQGSYSETKSSTGSMTYTVVGDATKYLVGNQYTIYIAGQTTTFTPTSGSGSRTVTMSVPYRAYMQGTTRTHTITFKFYAYSSYWALTNIQDTVPNYEYYWGAGIGYDYTFPKKTISTTQSIDVSTALINGREYQLEDLFGTSSNTLALGVYDAVAVLTGDSSHLIFSIPTGRVFPSGTTVERITCNMNARAGNSGGKGSYIIKASSQGADLVALDSDTSATFYDAYNTAKTLSSSMWSMSLQGRTNIRVDLEGDRSFFFTGSEGLNATINNQPTVIHMTNIVLYLNLG